MSSRYTKVKRHKKSLHRNCMMCGKEAKVTATRITGSMKMDVRVCEDHAREGGLIE